MYVRIWNEDMIISHILAQYGREPLNSHYYSTHYPRIYAAADRLFGSWGNAIYAAGLDYSQIRKYRMWDREQIAASIKDLYEKGETIASQYIQRNQKPLYMAAIHHFHSWGNAVQAAGINYKVVRKRRKMKPAEIRAEIILLYQQGEDLAYSNMRNKHSYLLACGSKKLGGGSWAEARRVCGIRENFRLPKAKRKRTRLSTHCIPLELSL